MQIKKKSLFIFQKIDFLNIKFKMAKYRQEEYLTKLIKKYPNISSGRKNYQFFYERLQKHMLIIKKFIKQKK